MRVGNGDPGTVPVEQSAFEAAGCALCVIDPDGIVKSYNAACEDVTGRKTMLGRVFWDEIVPPSDRVHVQEKVRACLDRNTTLSFEQRSRTASDTPRVVSWTCAPMRGPEGDLVVLAGHDITAWHERESSSREEEEALRRSEATTRAVLRAVPDLMFRLDEQGVVLEMITADEDLLYVKPSEFLGKPFQTLVPPHVADGAMRCLREALARGGVHTHEYQLDVPSGSRFFESRLIATGVRREVLGIIRDITARKATEEALRRSEESFRRLIERSPAIIAVHHDGLFTYANPAAARALGFDSGDELAGSPVADCIHPDDQAAIAERMRRVLATGEPATAREECFLRRDGTVLHAEITGIPLDFHGKPSILVMGLDVTDAKASEEARKVLERRMQEAQRLESLGVLAGGIAHDFNNLLMGVMGNAGIALMTLPPDSSVRKSVERIETAAHRAAELTAQMLAYSGRGTFLMQPVHLSRLVREMLELLGTVVSKKAILQATLEDDLPIVEADPTQMRQIVMNLITNASDALQEAEGVIIVRTWVMRAARAYLDDTTLGAELPEGSYVVFEVSDTGTGMEPETRDRMFDPFFTTKFAGRGLGLAAVLGIVRSHHGALRVDTEPGRGTRFRVLLPAAEPAPVFEPEPPSVPRTKQSAAGVVLVVDDEELVRSVVETVLESEGYEVLAAEDGLAAVEVFRDRADEICLVILDMTMPRMGGEEAFRELRAIRPKVPVVLSSGYNEQEAVRRFAGKGFTGFLKKPYTPDELLDLTARVLRG